APALYDSLPPPLPAPPPFETARPPPSSSHFPYTTLFRSHQAANRHQHHYALDHDSVTPGPLGRSRAAQQPPEVAADQGQCQEDDDRGGNDGDADGNQRDGGRCAPGYDQRRQRQPEQGSGHEND